jgi:hypothetical protein
VNGERRRADPTPVTTTGELTSVHGIGDTRSSLLSALARAESVVEGGREPLAYQNDVEVDRHPSPDRCLVFVHIPKTAGQSLHFAVLRNYPQNEKIHLNILDRPLDEEMERIPLDERSRARLLWGHVPYGVHEHIPRRCEYITILREPVDRVISVYKHILKSPAHVLHDRVVEAGIGLEDYVLSDMDVGQTRNSQVRQLSGRQFSTIDNGALEEAKHNLGGFLVAGLTERFEETFVLLRRALGSGFPLYVSRNVSPQIDVSERAIELIRERNELDLALYAFAQDLFRQQVARQSASFAVEVKMFKAWRPVARAIGSVADIVRGKSGVVVGRRSSR